MKLTKSQFYTWAKRQTQSTENEMLWPHNRDVADSECLWHGELLTKGGNEMIKRLKIMLPYLNDEYTVGEYPDFINQASGNDNNSQMEWLGKVVSIESPESNCYLIYFENGISRTISDTPVQIDLEVSE